MAPPGLGADCAAAGLPIRMRLSLMGGIDGEGGEFGLAAGAFAFGGNGAGGMLPLKGWGLLGVVQPVVRIKPAPAN